MELHTQILLNGEAGQCFPQLIVAGVFGIDAGINLDAAVVVIMPLFNYLCQFLALLVGVEVKVFVFVDEPVSGQGQIGLDAGFGNSFSGSIGVVINKRE